MPFSPDRVLGAPDWRQCCATSSPSGDRSGRKSMRLRSTLPQSFGVLGGHVAWSVQLLTSYVLVGVACATGRVVLLHLVTLSAALVSVAAWVVAVRTWGRVGASEASRFMALTGVLVNGL